MIDMEIWVGLFALTAFLYLIKWLLGRRKVKVYRISPTSLKRSKNVMLKMLPMIEDGQESPLDEAHLPFSKDHVKSAAKILAYYFWKEGQHEELMRVKSCFIGLSRFQNRDLEQDVREQRATREKNRLTKEFDCYLTHSPFGGSKAA